MNQDSAFNVDEDGEAIFGGAGTASSTTAIDDQGNVTLVESGLLIGKITEFKTNTQMKITCKCKLHHQCSIIQTSKKLPDRPTLRFRQWLAAGVQIKTGSDAAAKHRELLAAYFGSSAD